MKSYEKKYKCAECNHTLLKDDTFCYNCGSEHILQKCIHCGTYFDANEKICPKCHSRQRSMFPMVVTALTIVLVFLIFKFSNTEETYYPNEINNTSSGTKDISISGSRKKASSSDDVNEVEIQIKPMMSFSGMLRNEVLSLRKKAVKNSVVFRKIKNYRPNPSVFQIEDGLNWIGAYQISCLGTGNNPDIGKGDSRESLGILNPDLLIYLGIPEYYPSGNSQICSTADYMIPYNTSYLKKEKTIKMSVDISTIAKTRGYIPHLLFPADANARDFGYNYLFADAYQNIAFEEQKNMSNKIVATKGFYHKGHACGLAEGCNNYSPAAPEKELFITELPAKLHLKLWKEFPSSISQEADMNYVITFE